MRDNSKNTVRWAIVGTGNIARQFAADIRYAPSADLVSICSRDKDKAANFIKDLALSAEPISFDEHLDTTEIHAVYIATPNATHFDLAGKLMNSGKAVLVEKPITASSSDAQKLENIAKAKSVFLMEGMWTRFLPAIEHAKELIHTGKIGKIEHVSGQLAFPQKYSSENPFFDKETGGSLRDLGVYCISLSSFFFNEAISWRGETVKAPNGADLSAFFELSYEDFTASFSCALDREAANLFIIKGSEGTIVLQPPFNGCQAILEFHNGLLARLGTSSGTDAISRILRKLLRTFPFPGVERHLFPHPGYGLHYQVEAASQMILSGETSHKYMPMSSSIHTLRIIEDILAAN